MDGLLNQSLKNIQKARRNGRRYVAVLLCLSIIVGLGTFSLLSKEGEALTHQKKVLDCPVVQSGEAVAHVHNEDCYDSDGNLVCLLPEIAAHVHTEDCFQTVEELVCGLEENPGHVHTEDCYALTDELVCGLEESEGHFHTDDCYLWYTDYVCGQGDDPDHIHDDTCLGLVRGDLICELEESEGHTHSEACYARESEPSCGLAEGEGAHTHDESCYETHEICVCGEEELPVHVHGEGCFHMEDMSDEEIAALKEKEDREKEDKEEDKEKEDEEEEELEEEESFDVTGDEGTWLIEGDPDADVENEAVWQNMFAELEFSGEYARDLLTVAETQLGYGESMANYAVTPGGAYKGYTRYGAWYGIPYGEWCAMFVSFCIRWAGIPDRDMPIDCNCDNWVRTLSERGMFGWAESYSPKPGDLVFYDFNDDGVADHVGIVTAVDTENGVFETIEGNRSAWVERFTLNFADAGVMGWGILPEAPMPLSFEDDPMPEQHFEGGTDEVDVVVDAPEGAFPKGTTMRVSAVAAEDVMDAVSGSVKGEIASVQAVDICFFNADGEEIEPLKPVRVVMTPKTKVAGKDQTVVHVDDQGGANVVEQSESGEGEVAFDTDAFSVYALVYTVDFHYELDGKTFDYSIPGGGAISFRALAEALGIMKDDPETAANEFEQFLENVAKLEFSTPELMAVTRLEQDSTVGAIKETLGLHCEYSADLSDEQIAAIDAQQLAAGDWALISLKPFVSVETLTVTMSDGTVFAVKVTDAQIKKTVISASGETYEITVTYGPEAQIPDGAELRVEEILPENETYAAYYDEALSTAGEAGTSYARFFDIEIRADGQKIEPAADVYVKITLADVPDTPLEALQVVHFGSAGVELMKTETLETEADKTGLAFTADEFSVYSVVNVTSATNLNGQSFALVTGIAGDPGATTGYVEDWGTDHFTIIVNANAMMDTDGVKVVDWAGESGLGAEGVRAWSDSTGNYVGGDAPQWRFESAGGGRYRISVEKNGSRQYVTHNNATVSLTGNPSAATAFTITPTGDGAVLIHDGNWYLHNNTSPAEGWNEWVGRNYIVTQTSSPTGNEYKFRLCQEADGFEPFAARKIPAQELSSDKEFLIYRKFEDEQGNEALYALAHDGSFVRVYDGGDSVYWRETDKSVYWYYLDTGHGYTIFSIDPETGQRIYLNPVYSSGQTMSGEAVELTLLGKDNGSYGTAIENWDQPAYDYAGLHVTTENGTATLSAGTRVAGTSDEFLFAVSSSMPSAEPEPVDTVDSNALGIKITMFDYGDPDGNYNAGDKLPEMTAVAGSDEYTPHAAHALVTRYLTDGLPTSRSAGAMAGLFTPGGSAVTSCTPGVNHLFLQSYYDENGTFRYRSEDNHAYLPSGESDFIVYRQAATPYTTDQQPGHTYYYHGHFMPYNDIDMSTNLSRLMNQYGNAYEDGRVVGELPIGDGRTYEEIYGMQGKPNFYTGMRMEANFTQPRGGRLENGEEMIFKFTGDDDMWVYIDDVLVLDIGGIHEPLSGTINFTTGVVTNPSGSGLPAQTTLKQIFMDTLNDPGTPENVKEKIRQIKWNGDTFADYSNHSFSAFYMERGAGASNLDIQFNLKVTLTKEFAVEKELPDGIDPRFANERYKFQATYKDKDGAEKPRHAGIADVCTEVVYKDKTDKDGRPVPVEVDENGYFYLKPGEIALFKMADEGISYNVKEVEIDEDLHDSTVDINGDPVTVTDGTAEAGYEYVGSRSQVLFRNHPHTQDLLITKHITEDSAPIEEGENPVFEFRVYLESTVEKEDGTTERQLIPYSYAPYYLVKEVDGAKHYFTLTGEGNTPEDKGTDPVVCSTTGRSGSINSIPPEYTVVIPELIIGTNFYVEERRDNIPVGYAFVREELKEGTYDETDLVTSENVIERVLARDEHDEQEFDPSTVGRIKNGVDAESHVYNKKLAKETEIEVEKVWAGNMPAGSANLALYRVVGDHAAPSSEFRVLVQAAPAPVTTDAGSITVSYTGTMADGSEDSGSFVLSNATGWSRAVEFDRGSIYSFSYTPDGTKVTAVTPDQDGPFSASATVTLSTEYVPVAYYTYTFTVPADDRPANGSIDVTLNGETKTASAANDWTVSFDVAEDTQVFYNARPDEKFITGVSITPETASPAAGDVVVTMTPTLAAATMTVPVSVTWDESVETLPDDAQVTFTFTGNGETYTVALPASGSWNSSVDLPRLDENGDLIHYAVTETVTTGTDKRLTLSNVPTSISNSAEIAAHGVVKGAATVNVTVNRVSFWNDEPTAGYNEHQTIASEFAPGSTILITLIQNPNFNGSTYYRTSEGLRETISNSEFEVTIPQDVTAYTINVHDPWGGSAITIDSVTEASASPAFAPGMRKAVRPSPPAAAASTQKTFYDESVGGTGDLPFTMIQFKDLPADAELVETVNLTGGGTKTWTELPNFDERGNRIFYYVVEQDATARADTMTVTYSYTYRDDGSIEKVTITNTTQGVDTTDFSFTKRWRDPLGNGALVWPDKEITVTVKQGGQPFATYTITKADVVQGNEIAAKDDATKPKLRVETAEAAGYVFKLTGLPAEYTYTVSEETVTDYQKPQYYNGETPVQGASEIGNGGTICNDRIGYELPQTGGVGTVPNMVLGSLLMLAAGLCLRARQKRKEGEAPE